MPPKNFEEYTIAYGVGNQETKTWVATSESLAEDSLWYCIPSDGLTVSLADWNTCITTSANFSEPRPRRLRCEYCGCISNKEFGTCEHCGAPLTIEIV